MTRSLGARSLGALSENGQMTSSLAGIVEAPYAIKAPNRADAAPAAGIAQRFVRFSSQAPPSTSPPPRDTTLEVSTVDTFTSIVSLSQTTPVILDAYATWCAPCKQLDPVLKKMVADHAGKIILAKMDIDNPALAALVQQLRISSVPTLFMILGGRIVDIKQGVPPQSELKEWISKAVQVSIEAAGAGGNGARKETAPAAQQQDPKACIKEGFYAARSPGATAAGVAPLFAAVLEHPSADASDKASATAGLALCAALDGDLATAKELAGNAKTAAGEGVPTPEEVLAAEAAIALFEAAEGVKADGRSIDELHAVVESNPKDLDALNALVLRLFQAGRLQEAVFSALLMVRRDREWGEQAGRRLVMQLCDFLGSDSEVAKSGRKRLSNIWFI